MSQYFLTDSVVKVATCPEPKQQEIIWDSPIDQNGKVHHGSIAGLGLRITQKGRKAFIHSYHFNGRRARHVLGDVSVMNVASARLTVQKREIEISQGNNPATQFINYKQVHTLTISEVIDDYFSGRLVRLSKGHQLKFRALIAPWVIPSAVSAKGGPMRKPHAAFGTQYKDMPIETVTPRLISSYVNTIASDHQANSALGYLKAMFNWALKMQLIDMRNPCNPIEFRRLVRKRRNYTPKQIRTLTRVVFKPEMLSYPELPEPRDGKETRRNALEIGNITQANEQMTEFCHYMGILLLTMARPKEVREAEFDHFDLEELVWHKHNTKGLKLSRSISEYEYRSVPIHPRVADIVIRQRKRWPEAKYVFPCHLDPERPRNNFQRAIQRFKVLPDVPDYFQLYDLKRIAISLMITGQGVSRDAVSHYVDHRGNLDTTLIYDLGFVDPMRPVTKRLGELLELDDD